MKKPKLEALNKLFDAKKDFKLTDSQYENRTGATLPKQKSYLLNKSALAKMAKEKGFIIDVIEKTVILRYNPAKQ